MHNEVTIKRRSKKKKYSALSYRVNVYEYPSGDFVQQFDNYASVSEFFDIAFNVISKVCSGKEAIGYSKKYNKYYIFRTCDLTHLNDRTNLWKSEIFNIYDLYNDKENLFTKNKRERLFNIYKYPSGEFVKQYNAFKDAANELKISVNSISKAIMGITLIMFSKENKTYYLIRRVNYENMNNFLNIFDSGLMNIDGRLITKEDIDKSYNKNLEKYINLYAYPSGKFIKQFNYTEDVLDYFKGRIKNYTVYECLSDENTIFKDSAYESYFVLRYVDNKDDISNIDNFSRNELSFIINQMKDYDIIQTYNSIYDIRDKCQEFDIDLIFYHLQTDRKLYGFDWCYTRKHNQVINRDVMKLSSKRKIISVNKYSLDGKYICTYDDLYDISSNENKLNTIRQCLKGNIMSACGFIWKESNDYPIGKDLDIQKPVRTQFLYFSAYDDNDNLIESFKSTKVAAEKYGIVVRKIYRMLNKEVYINYNGMKIKFKKDEYNGLL